MVAGSGGDRNAGFQNDGSFVGLVGGGWGRLSRNSGVWLTNMSRVLSLFREWRQCGFLFATIFSAIEDSPIFGRVMVL